MAYTSEQIGPIAIRVLNSRSKDTYALYVDNGDEHVAVLIGVDWQAGKDKTAELLSRGVSPHDIYGTADDRTNDNWGLARKFLWLAE